MKKQSIIKPDLIKSILKFVINEVLTDISHFSNMMLTSKGRDKVFALA